MGVFGEKLRRQREQRGIALEAISNSTKISTRMLRALEEENFEQLPGGVFNKGFVRAYARQIGLDEEEAIADYLVALSESQIQSQQILPNLRGSKPAAISQPHPADRPSQAVEDGRRDTRPATGGLQGSALGRKNLPTSSSAPEQIAAVTTTSLHQQDPHKEKRRNEDRRNEDRRAEQRRANQNRQPGRRAESQSGQRFSEAAPLLEGRRASDLLSEAPRDQTDNDRRQSSTPLFSTGTFGESGDGSNGIPWGRVAALLVVIFVVIAFWNLHRHRQTRPGSRSSVQAAVPASELQTPLRQSTSTEAEKTNTLAGRTSSSQTSPVSTKLAAGTVSRVSVQNSASAQPSSALSPGSAPAAHARPAVKTPAAFTLRIRAQETSWISVIADGQPVAQETLIAPAETSIRASDRIVVRTGNAAGISFLLNAKEIPAQGKEGEVRTYTFDSTGLRESPAQPSSLTNN